MQRKITNNLVCWSQRQRASSPVCLQLEQKSANKPKKRAKPSICTEGSECGTQRCSSFGPISSRVTWTRGGGHWPITSRVTWTRGGIDQSNNWMVRKWAFPVYIHFLVGFWRGDHHHSRRGDIDARLWCSSLFWQLPYVVLYFYKLSCAVGAYLFYYNY